MKLIVGLGNPGREYRFTRHNIGFLVVDRLAEINNIEIYQQSFDSIFGKGIVGKKKIILAKPLTFMNLSGEAVKRLLNFFKINQEDLIVIHDDIDLDFGRIKIKERGGDGGHKGVRSIIEALGNKNFFRLRLGMGRPPPGISPESYVLGTFNMIERKGLEILFKNIEQVVEMLIKEEAEKAMNHFNRSIILE